MLSLLAGKPNTATFPITSISVNLKSPLNPSEEETVTIGGPGSSADLNEALQYSLTDGHPDLNNWLSDFQAFVHKRPRDGSWKLTIGAGSQDLIYKAFTALTNPGDSVLVEASIP